MHPQIDNHPIKFQNKGAYIIPIALGYSYVEYQQSYILVAAFLSFLAAIVIHGMYMSIYGTNSGENIDAHKTYYKRLQAAIWDADNADNYPSVQDLIRYGISGENFDYQYYRHRIPIAITYFLSILLLVICNVISIWIMWSMIPEGGFIPMLMLFGLLIAPLRQAIWKIFPSIHQREDIEATDKVLEVYDAMDQFKYLVNTASELTATKINYQILGGGIIDLEYTTDVEFEETISYQLDQVVFGFVAFSNTTKSPVNKLQVEFIGPAEEGVFTVDQGWIDEFQNGKMSREELIYKVSNTVNIL